MVSRPFWLYIVVLWCMTLVEKVCEVWFVLAISHPGLKAWGEMRDGNRALQAWALVVVCLRRSVSEGHTLTDEAMLSLGIQTQWWTGLYCTRIRCHTVCVCVFLQMCNHAEMWSKYIMFQGCTAVQGGLPLHLPNRKLYRVCRVYGSGRPRLTTTCSLSHSVFTSSSPPYPPWPPGLTFTEGLFCFLWASLTLPLCFPHSAEPLKDNSFPGTDSYVSPPPPPPLPLSPFIPSSCQLTSNQRRFLGIFLRKKKGGVRRLARSCHSSSELTSRAGLEQINRTKLIIDFNHY